MSFHTEGCRKRTAMSDNDSPKADSESPKGAQYAAEESDEESDTHCCAKCKLVFTKLNDYIQHKLSKDNCRVRYTKSRRILIPHIIDKGKEEAEAQEAKRIIIAKQLQRPLKSKRGPKNRRIESAHNKEDIIHIRPTYKCHACERIFSREAALKRHIEFDHTKQYLDSDEEAEDQALGDGETEANEPDAGREEEFQPPKEYNRITRPPRVVKVPQANTNLPPGVVLSTEFNKDDQTEEGEVDKPYACAICGRTFKDMNILKAHFLTHSDQRDYSCTWEGCTYAFKTKGSLKRHMRRHTGERPYICNKCGRAFGESGALTRHAKSRVPCVQKIDDDFPRYGKTMQFNLNIPAATAKLEKQEPTLESEVPDSVGDPAAVLNPSVRFVIRQPSTSSQQVATTGEVVLADGSIVPSVTLISVQTEAVSKDTGPPAMLIETSGIDGHAGEEEVVAEMASEDISNQQEINDEVEQEREEEQEDGEMDKEEEESLVNVCKACNSVFENGETLKSHLRSHLVDTPFRCGLCPFATAKKDTLSTHMEIVHQSALKTRKKSDENEETNRETIENVAPNVEAEASTDGTLLDHTGVSDVQSDIDIIHQKASPDTSISEAERDRQTRDASMALQQLLDLRDKGEERMVVPNGVHGYKTLYKCPVCARSFRGNAYLRLHMRTHTGEKPHKCPYCPKHFSTRDTLSKHLTVHSDERNYKCGECGKMFKRISHVREHLKVHSNERPFACTACFKSFKTANACKVHMRTHSAMLPFVCEFCHKNFREKGSLDRHIRTHTGEKPYRCRHCGRPFAEHGTLNRHLKAKVPCAKGLHVARTVTMQAAQQLHQEELQAESEAVGLKTDTADSLGMEVEGEEEEEALEAEEKFPTVLAEFSSVVADTQQYILQSHDEQAGAEFVMVGPNGETEMVQNVEVITNLDEATPEELQDVHYIMVNQDTNEYIVLNEPPTEQLELSEAGDAIVTLPSDGSVVDEVAVQTALAMIQKGGDQIEAIAMAPDHDVQQDGDTIYKAMMVANVVEEMDTVDSDDVV